MARRKTLVDELAPYRKNADKNHPWMGSEATHGPGAAPSRWNAKKDLSFEPLRPELVVEVGYDHMEGSRFRHTAQFKRWRPDRDPRSCTYEQLEEPIRYDLGKLLSN
jgi:ATP-dependent DNA ligase